MAGALPPPPGYVAPARGERRTGGGGRGGVRRHSKLQRCFTGHVDDRRHFDPQAEGTRRRDGLQHEYRRQIWWLPNGGQMAVPTPNAASPDAAMFANVKLPPSPVGRPNTQPQVIATKTLVIYGTGRSGGTPDAEVNYQFYAVDKATGKLLGAVTVPTRTSAVPMTFMHNGKQYIVYATGQNTSTALVALAIK
jgi:hypothetical protein